MQTASYGQRSGGLKGPLGFECMNRNRFLTARGAGVQLMLLFGDFEDKSILQCAKVRARVESDNSTFYNQTTLQKEVPMQPSAFAALAALPPL